MGYLCTILLEYIFEIPILPIHYSDTLNVPCSKKRMHFELFLKKELCYVFKSHFMHPAIIRMKIPSTFILVFFIALSVQALYSKLSSGLGSFFSNYVFSKQMFQKYVSRKPSLNILQYKS